MGVVYRAHEAGGWGVLGSVQQYRGHFQATLETASCS